MLGPAHDGGYWSVGLRRGHPDAFAGVPMSSDQTLCRQRERFSRLGLRTHEQVRLRDVDTIADAHAVAAQVPGSRFARALQELGAVNAPIALYSEALRAAGEVAPRPVARLRDGSVRPLLVDRWVAPADEVDERALADIDGPVLDVGCGPGRHLHALARRGVFGLGVDLSPVAVDLARGGGVSAIVGSIFGEVPQAGRWRSALLLDGNIGIGGNPVRLLSRVTELLTPERRGARRAGRARRRTRSRRWHAWRPRGRSATGFPWAEVSAAAIADLAAPAGLNAGRAWSDRGRWFVRLCRA